MTLTSEQQEIVAAAQRGESFVVQAIAGSGKTFTLTQVAKALDAEGKQGLYLCFNKANAEEAATKFPSSVECRTAHSLAYRTHGRYYRNRLRRVKPMQFIEPCNIQEEVFGSFTVHEGKVASMVNSALLSFCSSGATAVRGLQLTPEWLIAQYPELALQGIPEEMLWAFGKKILKYTDTAWEASTVKGSKLAVSHDLYLKQWELSEPQLAYDYIMFDEAQDASGAMISVLRKQDCQLIAVGDQHQQIYSWRGAVNALRKLSTDKVYPLTQSFRYGQKIADLASSILWNYKAVELDIIGAEAFADGRIDTVDSPDLYICRTNMGVMTTLLELHDEGISATAHGGTAPLRKLFESVMALQAGHWASVPELIGFASWESVRKFSQFREGADLKPLVNMVDEWGAETLANFCADLENLKPWEAETVVATAHRVKGLEADTVKLHNDFPEPSEEDDGLSEEEANLLYVACTRARKVLDISLCEAAIQAQEAI